jgi:2-C-methyl-D-erythritol 4-phosphate cytidylyltransferase
MVMHVDYIDLWKKMARQYQLIKFIRTVSGGKNRQDSVYLGIRQAEELAD